MAWRIHKSVVRGEIDNREKGRVTGKIWLCGREEPVLLELTGNPWRDLAGQQLRFVNPKPEPLPEHYQNFAQEQTGVVGDMTAARKVKVLEIPEEEIGHYYKNKIPMPYHWGNSVYLEWHSARNGRVVIESAEYELETNPEATWSMSEDEEAEQQEANGRAMVNFMNTMLEAAEASEPQDEDDPFALEDNPREDSILPFPEAEDDDAPQSKAEAEADAEAARMELLNDRIMARLEKEPDADAEAYARIIEEERERLRRERGEPEPKPTWLSEADREFIETEEWNARVTETFAKEGEAIDDEPDDPLVEQCQELGHDIHEEIETQDWLPDDAQEEHPLLELRNRIWFAGAKLAGVLHNAPYAWPPDALVAGNSLVRLKKAREYLRDSLAALQTARDEQLCPADWLDELRPRIEVILDEVQELIRDARRILREAEEEQGGN